MTYPDTYHLQMPKNRRVAEEMLDVDDRLFELQRFINASHNPALVCTEEYPLLRMQEKVMALFSDILLYRTYMSPGMNFNPILEEGNHLIVRAQMAKKAGKPLVGPFTAKQLERAHKRNARVVEKKKRAG